MAKKKKRASLREEIAAKPEPGQVKALQKQVAQLEESLDNLRSAKFVLPTGKRSRGKNKAFCRVIIPDTHGCFIQKDAWKAFITDLELIQPNEIVWIGDHLDCGGFMAEHFPYSYLEQSEYTFEEDVGAANATLDSVLSAVKHADHYYIEGNHEARMEQWIIKNTGRNHRDAKYLRTMWGPEIVMSLEKRGINFFQRGKCYMGLEHQNMIKLGSCYFVHGKTSAATAAKTYADKYVCNIVYGHTHRADSYVRRTVDRTIGAYNSGCLCRLQPLWRHTDPTNWSHGYGIQAVQADGHFLNLNVPIIKGRSLLGPLATGVVA